MNQLSFRKLIREKAVELNSRICWVFPAFVTSVPNLFLLSSSFLFLSLSSLNILWYLLFLIPISFFTPSSSLSFAFSKVISTSFCLLVFPSFSKVRMLLLLFLSFICSAFLLLGLNILIGFYGWAVGVFSHTEVSTCIFNTLEQWSKMRSCTLGELTLSENEPGSSIMPSIILLTDASASFEKNCVRGIQANSDRISKLLHKHVVFHGN
ncbi:hypothetical protein LXL04_018185 [Taraxacum kok-saghyz]